MEGKKDVLKNGQEAMLVKLKKQVIIAVIIGVVLLLLSIICNVWASNERKVQLEVSTALNQYQKGSKALSSAVQAYSVDGGEQYYDEYMNELNIEKNRDNAIAVLKKHNITDEEWVILNRVISLAEGLAPLEEYAMESVKHGDLEAAQAYVFSEEYKDKTAKIDKLIAEAIETVQERMERETNITSIIQIVSQMLFILAFTYVIYQLTKIVRFAKTELLVPIQKVSEQIEEIADGNFESLLDLPEDNSEVGSMVKAIAFMKSNMLNMVREISEVLGSMGDGDYNVEIKEKYVGEFVKIKDSLVTIGERMRETLHTIRNVSEQINSGSEQLAFAAQDLAEGSSTQATQVTELVEVMKNMSRNMENNAAAAEESVQIASNAGVILMGGNEKMQELKAAIAEISKCSEQIRGIIETIDDIASQTNLLSLNAAIEAARAGEAGKGFAVVADQVKNLAEESGKAAGKTTELIETTIAAVDKGIEIADATVDNMIEVMSGAKEATEKMSRISGLLKEEVNNIHEVNEMISAVSAVVDNNSATSQETAAVSEEQKAQVETMVQLMEHFKI